MLQKIKKLFGLESKVNEILPRYYFDNIANLSKSEIQDLTFHIRHYEENLPAIESRGINLEEFATIDYLLLNQNDWVAEKFNLSLENRCPEMCKIHFLLENEMEEWQKFYSLSKNTYGSFKSYGTIFVVDFGKAPQTFGYLNHELVHSNSAIRFNASKRKDNFFDVSDQFIGYYNFKNKKFNVLNEALTEMINIETLDYFRNNEKHGKDILGSYHLSYKPEVLFFDLLIEEAGKRLNMCSNQIRNELYKGYFTGSFKPLNLFEKAFGKGTLKTLADMPFVTNDDLLDMALYIRKFGIVPSYFSQLMNFDCGKEISICGGIKIQKR